MAKLTGLTVGLVLLACAAVAAAAPCIECKDCQGMQSCYQVCKQTCPKAPPAGNTVNGQLCEGYGALASGPEAQKACDLTMKYCSNAPPGLSVGAFPVSLGQCANIAYGVCQAHALDHHKSPCGHHFKGYQQCSGQQFMGFYSNIVNDGCRNAIQWIQQAAKTTGRRLKH
ncbi:hypothetical protein OEZ85_006318 [Tetradesmus obliquus]|uniref:Uncharacterized protein n=1 Tax=Tetradesmus obliquus TaxID=3088 RepID=A0ABY8TWJ3_TETOB|nr:hypothetical protein OEZ85_006318 [Tetradesmus obliquus]